MKDRKDLIPAENNIVRGKIIVQARGRAVKVLSEQKVGTRENVAKILKRAQDTFWAKCDKIDKRYGV